MEEKKYVVRHENQSGLYKMFADFFKNVIYSQRGIHIQMQNIRNQAWEIFTTFKKEYMDSLRPKLLWGYKTSSEANMEANEYGMKMMKNFFDGCDQQIAKVVSYSNEIAKETPAQFLTAIKGVLSQENGKTQLQEPGEEIGQYALEDFLKKMTMR
jgi:hypothetical protein